MSSPDTPRPGTPGQAADTAALRARLRARYCAAADTLDTDTSARLRAIRRDAMQRAAAPSSARWRGVVQRLLLPAGAFAMLALASLIVWRPAPSPTPHRPSLAAAPRAADVDNDLPPDPDSADPALYQNLAFYNWLASNDSGKAAHAR